MAFTSVAARKFASPSCQQLRALSSRFSGSGCPESEGTRLSGERVITRADSFHSASTSTSRRTHLLKSQGEGGELCLVFFATWRLCVIIFFQPVDDSRDAVLDQSHVEVDRQAKPLVGEPEVGQ